MTARLKLVAEAPIDITALNRADVGDAERLENAVNSVWALKELANGLGETLIEAEAERLLDGIGWPKER